MESLAGLAGTLGSVMLFLIAITLVAEVAAVAGVFEVAGHWAARAGRGRTVWLWLLLVLIATTSTVFLSLDTTAVLLTPVALAVAGQTGIAVAPFALTTLWLANTASLLLPVSNLTNLLARPAFRGLGVTHAETVALMWRPEVAAVLGTVVVLWLFHRRGLSGRYAAPAREVVPDRLLFRVAGATCVLLAVAFALGAPPAPSSAAAAVVLLVTLMVRRREAVTSLSVPWRMAVGVAALVLLVAVTAPHLHRLLIDIAGSGHDPAETVRLIGLAAVTSNVGDNLPAYAVLAPVASGDEHRLAALLVGVDVTPLVTPWASLATVLWAARCRTAGVRISPARLAGQGAVCVMVATGAAAAALLLW